jgi:hypothetical protein
VSAAVAKSDFDLFVGKGFRVLWLQDSTIAIALAIVFAILAIRPFAASKIVIVLLGLVPVITAALAYHFIGRNFVGGHIFLTAGAAAIFGGLLGPRRNEILRINAPLDTSQTRARTL